MEIRIGFVKEDFANAKTKEELESFISTYENDARNSVIALVERAKKAIDALEKEIARTEVMKKYEYENEQYGFVCGIDEVGRGPLAGPVVACAVILSANSQILYLNDSKKLSEKKREELYDVIMKEAVAVGIGMRDAGRIDEINILQATFLAMQRALDQLTVRPDLALIDGNRAKDFGLPVKTVVKGDSLSANIAAASILAKVTRDNLMQEMAESYPQYGFEIHKGYGTKEHYAALREFGASPIHRMSFLKKFYGNQ